MSEMSTTSAPTALPSAAIQAMTQPTVPHRRKLPISRMPTWLERPTARKKLSRLAVAVLLGLDPRTHYPRCDVCGERPTEGARQVGRWCVCAVCLADPETARLSSLYKGSYAYSSLLHKVIEALWEISEAHTTSESAEAHARLAQLAHESGLIKHTGLIPSKDRTSWKQRVQREERAR